MCRYIEYNLINNIPIIYPEHSRVNFLYCPRYTIADADKIIKCNEANINISIYGTKYKYVKIDIGKSFKTLNNDIEALYCYLLVDTELDYNVCFENTIDVFRWLERKTDNHFILITTPVMKYKNTYYSVANDDKISTVYHNDISDDAETINVLVQNNCYTICDNYNIVISLFHKGFIEKTDFLAILNILRKKGICCYTNSTWFRLMNQHRILNACDFPTMFLCSQPNIVDEDIYALYDKSLFDNNYVYMQSLYKKNIIYTTVLSNTYPLINLKSMRILTSDDVENKLWVSSHHIVEKFAAEKNTMYHITYDFYGIFATILSSRSIWKFWKNKKSVLMGKLTESYSINGKIMLLDVLYPLFRLYTNGFEGIKIKRKRVREIWQYILKYTGDIMCDVIEHFIVISDYTDIPYVFMMDMHAFCNVKYDIPKRRLVLRDKEYIYKNISLYDLLECSNNDSNIFHFHENVLKKRMLIILTLMHHKFGMFANSESDCASHLVGDLVVLFLKNNREYLL